MALSEGSKASDALVTIVSAGCLVCLLHAATAALATRGERASGPGRYKCGDAFNEPGEAESAEVCATGCSSWRFGASRAL
jgi:hypothetical protein